MIHVGLLLLFVVWLLDGFKKTARQYDDWGITTGYIYILALMLLVVGVIDWVVQVVVGGP